MEIKIERIEVFGVAIPLVQTYHNARGPKSVQKSVIVRVHGSNGMTGAGNIDPVPGGFTAETTDDALKILRERLVPAVTGLDPLNIHELLKALDAATPRDSNAQVAIEMACVDLAAKTFGVPVHSYLGGAVMKEVEFNAWIGVSSPEEAAREALRWFKQGFRSGKIKVGSGIQADIDRVAAVRDAVGPSMALRIDANESYDAETSISLAKKLARYDIQLFEQPAPRDDLKGLAQVRSKGGIPVMADESVSDHESLIAIIKAGAADIVKLKLMKQGGFHRTSRMLATAEAAGMRCVIGHGFGQAVSTSAEIMLSCTSRNVIPGLECVGPLKTRDFISTLPFDISKGRMAVPQGPGLDVTLDDRKLAKYAIS